VGQIRLSELSSSWRVTAGDISVIHSAHRLLIIRTTDGDTSRAFSSFEATEHHIVLASRLRIEAMVNRLRSRLDGVPVYADGGRISGVRCFVIVYWQMGQRRGIELAYRRKNLKMNLTRKTTPTAHEVRIHGGQDAKKVI
jgi:hypothetical protein